MNTRLTWCVATAVVVAAVLFLIYGTHSLTILERVLLRLF